MGGTGALSEPDALAGFLAPRGALSVTGPRTHQTGPRDCFNRSKHCLSSVGKWSTRETLKRRETYRFAHCSAWPATLTAVLPQSPKAFARNHPQSAPPRRTPNAARALPYARVLFLHPRRVLLDGMPTRPGWPGGRARDTRWRDPDVAGRLFRREGACSGVRRRRRPAAAAAPLCRGRGTRSPCLGGERLIQGIGCAALGRNRHRAFPPGAPPTALKALAEMWDGAHDVQPRNAPLVLLHR